MRNLLVIAGTLAMLAGCATNQAEPDTTSPNGLKTVRTGP